MPETETTVSTATCNQQTNSHFKRQVNFLTGKPAIPGIIEAIDYINKIEYEKKVYRRIITNLIVKVGFSNEQLATMTEASLETIENIRKKLNQ